MSAPETDPATTVLAKLGARVTAVDTHRPFLYDLLSNAITAGVADSMSIDEVAMEPLDYPDHHFDLIWAEGSAYMMGVDNALMRWRRLLARWCRRTDRRQLADHRSESRTGRFLAIRRSRNADRRPEHRCGPGAGLGGGSDVLLPNSDWDELYGPLAASINRLRHEQRADDEALDIVEKEIHIRRRFAAEYGNAGYVLRPAQTITDA